MLTYFPKLIFSCLLMTCASCFTARKEREIKDQFDGVNHRIEELEKNLTEKGQSNESHSRKSLASLNSEVERINLELSRIKGEIEALRIGVQSGELPGNTSETPSVLAKINELQTKVDQLSLNASSSSHSVGAVPSAKANQAQNSQKVDATLRELRENFIQKKYQLVLNNSDSVMPKLKSKGAKEELAFLVAESLFKIGKTREAALKFNDFGETFGSSQRMALVKLRLGECFNQLGDSKAAKSFFQEVVARFPKSPEAGTAKDQLKQLGNNGAKRSTKDSRTNTAEKASTQVKKRL